MLGNDVIVLTESTQVTDNVVYESRGETDAASNDAITDFKVGASADGGDQIDINFSIAGQFNDASGVTDVTLINADDAGEDIAEADAIIISTVTGAFNMDALTTDTVILNVNLAGNIATEAALQEALEIGGLAEMTMDNAVVAKDAILVTYDNGVNSFLAFVEFGAGIANDAQAADGGLTATNMFTFTGVADSTTLIGANFDFL